MCGNAGNVRFTATGFTFYTLPTFLTLLPFCYSRQKIHSLPSFLQRSTAIMIIGVLKESLPETRVSLTPEVVQALTKMGVTVWIAKGAGEAAYYPDDTYEAAGAKLMDASAMIDADLLLTI